MRKLREFAEVVDLLVLPMLGRVLLFLLVPVTLVIVLTPPLCACNSKEKAYRAAMRSDLHNLVIAEEAYFRDHGHYTTTFDTTQFRASTGVVVDSIVITSTGFTARATYPTSTLETCHVVYGPDWTNESRPTCDGDPSGRRAKRKLP